MARFTDDAGRADSTELGADWDQYTGINPLQIVSNKFRGQSGGGADTFETIALAQTNDQYARATLATFTGADANTALGVLLRAAAPSTHTNYGVIALRNAGGTTTAINEVTAGSLATLASETATTWAANDILLAYARAVQGSTTQLNVFRNGAFLLGVQDASLTSGRTGLLISCATLANAEADDFEAGDLPITYVGVGAFTSGSGASITPAIPGSTQAGDLALCCIVGRPTDTTQVTTVSNGFVQVPSATALQEVGANDLRAQVFYKVLVGGDSNPAITLPASWQGTSAGAGAAIAVWRGVDAISPFDATSVGSTSAAADTWQQTGITTVSNWALVVSFVCTSDDNALSLVGSPAVQRGFAPIASGASYQATASVGDFAIGIADFVQPAAAAVSMPTWDQTLVGADPWAGCAIALRPSERGVRPTIVSTAVRRAAFI